MSLADDLPPRSLAAVLQLLGDIRLAVLAATSVLLALDPSDAGYALFVLPALPVVWLLRRPRPRPESSARWRVAVTALDLCTAVPVLALSGIDSFALVYSAMTVAVTAVRLGAGGALAAGTAIVVVHVAGFLAAGASPADRRVALVLAVRLGLVVTVGYAAARLRTLLLVRERLGEEVRRLREEGIRDLERQRLARDLHDSLAKTLHGAVLLACRFRSLRTTGHPDAGPAAAQLLDVLRRAQLEARAVLCDLREEAPTDLRAGLTGLADDFRAHSGIGVQLALPDVDPAVDPQARTEVLKAVGELLENVQRHAAASVVRIGLGCSAEGLTVSVADDGRGMPAPDLEALSRGGHYGLVGVRERMLRLGGELQVGACPTVSPPGRGALAPPGTEVRLVLPQDHDELRRLTMGVLR
jgi:signal transduction histidine kinase